MALTSAFYTGLSGLDVNQTAMNVIGNNIANVNTNAFKSSRALFTPQFYVTDAGSSAPSSTFGGTNPSQRGLGASVATVEKDFSQGSIQSTGVDTDMAIQGDGFFVLQGAKQSFTRDGAFVLNAANQLVNSSGQFVQGYGVDGNYNIVPGKLQTITIPLGAASAAQPTQNVQMEGNLNAGGAVATGASILNSQQLTLVGGGVGPIGTDLLTNVAATSNNAVPLFNVGQTLTLSPKEGTRDVAPETFTVSATSTMDDLTTFLQGGLGINTSVPPIGTEPTPGVSVIPDPTDPSSSLLAIVGNPGNDNAITLGGNSLVDNTGATPLTFDAGVDAAGNTSNPNGESVHTSAVVYDSLGNPITVDVTAVFQGASSTGTSWQFYATSPNNNVSPPNTVVGQGTLNFDTGGNLLSSTGTSISVDRTGTGAKSPMSFKLDFSGMTSLASQSSNMVMGKQDGTPLGSLTSFSIGDDGTITGSFTNGLTRSLGQVAVATFNNDEGLDDDGGNLYSASADSGAPVVTTPLSLGSGSIVSGSLEQSNVDLSKEFINLIIASTGFSAASRVISTSDQMLHDLLNTSQV